MRHIVVRASFPEAADSKAEPKDMSIWRPELCAGLRKMVRQWLAEAVEVENSSSVNASLGSIIPIETAPSSKTKESSLKLLKERDVSPNRLFSFPGENERED